MKEMPIQYCLVIVNARYHLGERSGWKDNIKVDIGEMSCEHVNFLRIGAQMGQVLAEIKSSFI